MCRSVFISTLATLLAGTHAAGPVLVEGLPRDARCTRPRAVGPCALPCPPAPAADR